MAISGHPLTGFLDITASAGASRAVVYAICDENGLPVTGWDDSVDTVTVEVWAGDDLPVLDETGVTVAFANDALGTVRITTNGTHALAAKKYQWRCLARSAGTNYEIIRGMYDVLNAPVDWASTTGDAATAPYTTIDDLRTVAGWIDQIQGKHDQAGLMEHQRAARQWLDNIVLNAWRSTQRYDYAFPTYAWGFDREIDTPQQWLVDVLATGSGIRLDYEIKRACAFYACSLACSAQVSVDENASQYRKKATEFRLAAANIIACRTIYVKSSTTATTYTVPISTAVHRRN